MEGARYIWCHQNIYGLITLRSVLWKDLNDTSTGKNKIIHTNVKVSRAKLPYRKLYVADGILNEN